MSKRRYLIFENKENAAYMMVKSYVWQLVSSLKFDKAYIQAAINM